VCAVPSQRSLVCGREGPIRIGVVGFGKMGLLHAAIFNRLRGSTVVAIAEPIAAVRAVLEEMNPTLRVHTSAELALDSEAVDAVVIATPVSDHIPVAIDCVSRGIPFFMEKPLATSVAEGRRLLTRLQARPTPHMVGFVARFAEPFEKAHELLRSGCLGVLHRVRATVYASQVRRRGRSWRYTRQHAGGGVLLSQGSHAFDLLTWYFGSVVSVNGERSSVYSAEVEDQAHVILRFASGLGGWLDCSWVERFRRSAETTIEVVGKYGHLVVKDDSLQLFLERPHGGMPEGWSRWTGPDLCRGVQFDVAGSLYTREDEAFLELLRTGKPADLDVVQALNVQGIVEAAYESADAGGAPRTPFRA
jgi:predicted dehydrogenase